jgi:hypothetical protein
MNNHCHCDHKLRYCEACDVVYCKSCKKEWGKYVQSWTYHYPITTRGRWTDARATEYITTTNGDSTWPTSDTQRHVHEDSLG